MFQFANNFNQPLDEWIMSNNTNIRGMFRATNFNHPINSWDTSAVTNMDGMFLENPSFNQPLDEWNTSNVVQMNNLFRGAISFDQDLSDWNISSVQTMQNMFSEFPQSPPGFLLSLTPLLTSWNELLDEVAESNQVVGLSTHNQNSTLTSWATQATNNNIQNIPLHLGLKTYTQEGANALATLKDLGWTIEEQYQAAYHPGTRATLIGHGTQAPLVSGATTTSVTIHPDRNCTFVQWSDGNTDNPRSDTLTDNLTVTADVRCSQTGTSARTQAERTTNSDRFRTTTSTPPTTHATPFTPPATLEESLTHVRTLPETITTITAANPTPETTRTLLDLLVELVETLTLLMNRTMEAD